MKRSGPYTIFSILSAMLLLSTGNLQNAQAQVFSQDLTMHSTTTNPGFGGRGGGSVTGTDYFSKNAARMKSSDGNDTIIRFDTQKFIMIDNKKKTYSEMTFNQLQEAAGKAAAALGDVSSEEMAIMKKMMGQIATSFTVTKVGPGETIAGYATEKYLLKGPMDIEIYSAATLKIPAAYYDVMKIRMPANPLFDLGKMYDEMKKINGIPLKTVSTTKMMGTEMKTTKLVTSIEKGAIPASVFEEIPAGYKLVPATN